MRKAVLFLGLFAGFCSVSAQSSKTIRTYGITKKTETVIKYDNGTEVSRYIEEVELYNPEGDWVEKFIYGSDGNLKLHQKRVYEGDDIVDETTIDLNGSGIKEAKPPSFERIRYTYEKGDVMTETEISADGKTLRRKEHVYNKLGDLVEVITKDENEFINEREITDYDKRGLKIKERVVDSSGVILKEKIFQYE